MAGLLRPLWHLGGPSSDPEGLRSIRRETLESQLGFLSIMRGFRDRILIDFMATLGTTNAFVVMRVRRSFFNDFEVCF